MNEEIWTEEERRAREYRERRLRAVEETRRLDRALDGSIQARRRLLAKTRALLTGRGRP